MAGGLDIQTPKGQVTLLQERQVIDAFHRECPKYHYVETNKDRDAVNDGIIFNRDTNIIVAICETKCRGATIEQLEGWNNEWLITWKKVKRIAAIAKEMRIRFTGILYLVPSELVLMAQIYDGSKDQWLIEPRLAETETQATINGGIALRENAFFDMSNAKRFKV